MRTSAFLKGIITALFSACFTVNAHVTWHSITPEIQFLKQQAKLRFYDSNQVLIEGKECALMFDASGDFAAVEQLASTLKQRLKTPLCYLVGSHYHDDHLLGMAVLQAQFPTAKLIVHQQVAENFAHVQRAFTDKLDSYEKSIELSYQRLATLPKEQQHTWREKLTLAKQRLLRWRELSLKEPALIIAEQTKLDLGNYPIIIEPYHAHTYGDLTLLADNGQILLGGDMVDSLPYPGHGQLTPWLNALTQLAQSKTITTILPGHGEKLTPAMLAKPIAFLSTIEEQVKAQPNAPVEELITTFPITIKQSYQSDEIGERAFNMFLEAGLKQAKTSK